MIRNIVFDIGNVLVFFGWKPFLEKFDMTEEERERVANATVKNPVWNEIDRGLMTEEEILDKFIEADPGVEDKIRMFYEDFGEMLTQFEYTKGLIIDLKRKGFKVFALSNMSHKATRECPAALDFLPMLDGYVLSCNVKLIKPDRNIYETFLKKYSLIPSECVFIDDLNANVETAIECSMHGIVFEDLKSTLSKLGELIETENFGSNFESRYSKGQRIAALVCIAVIVLMYLSTLVFSLLKFEWAGKMFRVSLGMTLVLPVMAWLYIWMIGKLRHKDTIADFKFFE